MLARAPAKAAPELELKFQLGAGALEALEGSLFPRAQAKVSQLHATYFDTPGHALRDQGFSLRVRRKGETFTQTLKHRDGGALFQRDEWETRVGGADLDLDVLAGTPAAAAIAGAPLAPAFTVEVERRIHVWSSDAAQIEVSLDTGAVVAGERRDPIAELELELLAGPPQALFDLARQLMDVAPLILAFESKAERGYRLVGHDGLAALKAQRNAVGPKTAVAPAFQVTMRGALVQVAGNADLLRRANNPDALHQLRVGLRRLRAGLSVFKAILDAEGFNRFRAETRWLAGELSDARDIDVFLQKAAVRDEIEENDGRAAFFRALRIAQAEAYERAVDAVGSPRFRALLLDVAEWVEAGAWRHLDDAASRRLREGPVTVLAAPVLAQLDQRLRRRSRRFLEIDAAARHDLRKQAKKLRYAAAFFAEAFTEHPKRRARFVAALRALQDHLGELNDMAVARSVALKAVGKRNGELAFAAGLEVGRLTEAEAAVMDAADRAFKAYRKVKPFWPSPDGRNEDLNLSGRRLNRA
ncbi:CHAD domain-containing protein [Phenylobacterium sp.]|uniref:CYTH and CHAD domain-containing protein n=1 Tax=Phenylobacterium sp. TaxID=1871053 RepID=UPI00301B8374